MIAHDDSVAARRPDEPSAAPPDAPSNASLRFFDEQFRRQAADGVRVLNPFEQRALPCLRGRVLDWGCGLGNLSLAAAARGCQVLALDASAVAIAGLRAAAAASGLAVDARQADLRVHEPTPGAFDAAVAIGLLMFFDRPTAARQLARLQAAVRPGGVAVVNVLVQGTTYMDMFDPAQHHLFDPAEPARAFDGWALVHTALEDFDAPRGLRKRFATVIARRPGG
jgi:tellurite methyltransferase